GLGGGGGGGADLGRPARGVAGAAPPRGRPPPRAGWSRPAMLRTSAPLPLVCLAAAARGDTPTPSPPKLRLGDAAVPVRYAARLRIVPSEPTFAGTIDIELKLKAPAAVVWMNGTNLTIARAPLHVGRNQIPA